MSKELASKEGYNYNSLDNSVNNKPLIALGIATRTKTKKKISSNEKANKSLPISPKRHVGELTFEHYPNSHRITLISSF